MQRFTSFLDELSYRWLVPLALLVTAAPWPAGPEPHLWEKLVWLFNGMLVRPLDIFDLFFHAAPLALLIAKGFRDLRKERESKGE